MALLQDAMVCASKAKLEAAGLLPTCKKQVWTAHSAPRRPVIPMRSASTQHSRPSVFTCSMYSGSHTVLQCLTMPLHRL